MSLPIATETLVLRSFREDDLEDFLEYRNDPGVARFQSWDGISREDAAAFLRTNAHASLVVPGKWRQVAIALGATDRLIGDIGILSREDGRTAELGFTLASGHQGRGLAGEAVSAVIDALFDRAGVERLEAVTDTRNLSAMALLERLGFDVQSTADARFKGADCREHTYALARAGRRV